MQTFDVQLEPIFKYNVMIAPAFYETQVDLCGPFKAYSMHHKRTTIKVWLIIHCCMSTKSAKIMDDYSTKSFIQSFIRFSCEFGYPKFMLMDEGIPLVKGCQATQLCFNDIKGKLYKDMMVYFGICPVGRHNFNGKTEGTTCQIKESLEKSVLDKRLSVLQWEAVAPEISNAINYLLALENLLSDFENMDLITPKKTRRGRNNNRSPVSPMKVTGNYQKMLEENKKIYNTWFEAWLTSHVQKLMDQPKWFQSNRDSKICDVGLFIKKDDSLVSTY